MASLWVFDVHFNTNQNMQNLCMFRMKSIGIGPDPLGAGIYNLQIDKCPVTKLGMATWDYFNILVSISIVHYQ